MILLGAAIDQVKCTLDCPNKVRKLVLMYPRIPIPHQLRVAPQA